METYLRDINETALLTAAQEKQLAVRVNKVTQLPVTIWSGQIFVLLSTLLEAIQTVDFNFVISLKRGILASCEPLKDLTLLSGLVLVRMPVIGSIVNQTIAHQ